jgi:hypothetical protein
LLQQYGGMWVDASLLPMVSAEFFLPYVLQDNEYFTYRFIPRICPIDRSGDRECVSWLQIVTRPNHYLLNQWLLEFCDLFIHADPYPFYGVHQSLARLYDKNLEIRCVINSMPQISQHIPHSLTENKAKKTICHKEYLLISDNSHRLLQEREQRFRYFYSFVYKRPRHVDVLLRIASSWHDDISAGRDLSTIEVENAGLFPVKNMTDPLIGHDYSALMSTLRDGICFYDTKNTEMKIQPSIA